MLRFQNVPTKQSLINTKQNKHMRTFDMSHDNKYY